MTDQTRHLIDEVKLKKMKRGAILVNIARGAVVDMNALINALSNLGGAVLDVFEEEPLEEEDPLWEMENRMITPHNSFIGEKNNEILWKIIERNLK